MTVTVLRCNGNRSAVFGNYDPGGPLLCAGVLQWPRRGRVVYEEMHNGKREDMSQLKVGASEGCAKLDGKVTPSAIPNSAEFTK